MIWEVLVVMAIAVVVFAPMFLRNRVSRAPEHGSFPGTGPGYRDVGAVVRLNGRDFVFAVLAGGVTANILDVLVHGLLLSAAYAPLPDVFRPDSSLPLLMLVDFVAAAVFVWVYDRVRGSFGPGFWGGATFGLYAGVLVGFPTHLLVQLVVADFPFVVAWAWTIHQVVWGVVVGSVVGAVVGTRA